jgi:Uma2 family endonuclease
VPPLHPHGNATLRLGALLIAALPDHHVTTETYLRLPRHRVRLPDIAVTETVEEDGWISEPPLMVAEVLSRSTRTEDTVRKSVEYAEAGISQYWLLDPPLRTLTVMSNIAGTWEDLLRLDEDDPEGSVELASVAISVDLRELLRG